MHVPDSDMKTMKKKETRYVTCLMYLVGVSGMNLLPLHYFRLGRRGLSGGISSRLLNECHAI